MCFYDRCYLYHVSLPARRGGGEERRVGQVEADVAVRDRTHGPDHRHPGARPHRWVGVPVARLLFNV